MNNEIKNTNPIAFFQKSNDQFKCTEPIQFIPTEEIFVPVLKK